MDEEDDDSDEDESDDDCAERPRTWESYATRLPDLDHLPSRTRKLCLNFFFFLAKTVNQHGVLDKNFETDIKHFAVICFFS